MTPIRFVGGQANGCQWDIPDPVPATLDYPVCTDMDLWTKPGPWPAAEIAVLRYEHHGQVAEDGALLYTYAGQTVGEEDRRRDGTGHALPDPGRGLQRRSWPYIALCDQRKHRPAIPLEAQQAAAAGAGDQPAQRDRARAGTDISAMRADLPRPASRTARRPVLPGAISSRHPVRMHLRRPNYGPVGGRFASLAGRAPAAV